MLLKHSVLFLHLRANISHGYSHRPEIPVGRLGFPGGHSQGRVTPCLEVTRAERRSEVHMWGRQKSSLPHACNCPTEGKNPRGSKGKEIEAREIWMNLNIFKYYISYIIYMYI